MKTIALSALVGALIAQGAAAQQAPQYRYQAEPGSVSYPRGTLVIRNLDAVWTAAGEVLQGASIVIEDGVIRAIGPSVSAPRGAVEIDGSGLTAIPGIVDQHSHIAMAATNEGSAPITPEVRVLDALNANDFNIYRALSGGVTAAQILHGSANPIGGQSAIIKTRWGMDEGRLLLIDGAPQTVKFALGENVTRKSSTGSGPQRYPASREGVEAIYVQAFTAAQEYQRAWDAYRENPRAHRIPPRRDLRLEALADILSGQIRVHAHSYRSDEIVMLMRVAERFGFKIDVFTHVLEGYKVADEMAKHGAGGSTFSDWWAYKLEAYDAIPYNAAIMHQHGVLASLNSDIPWLQSFMIYEFNKPVKYGGVSREDALRMLTLYPAQQLRIDQRVGSLETGKDGDLVLLSGDPFDTYARVEKTIVDGIVYYDRARDAELRKRPVRPMPVVTTTLASASTAVPPSTPARLAAARLADGCSTPGSGAAEGGDLLLVGATVHPVGSADIPNGAVHVRGRCIVAVGPTGSVDAPAGASRVDLTGKHLYPGLVDPLTSLGLVEVGQIAASRDDREVGRYNPHVRTLPGVHPHSEAIPVARANGITATLTVSASGVIRGTGSVIQLSGDTPERMGILDRAALVISFPSATGEQWDEPKLEGDRLEELIELFDRAILYAKEPSSRDDPTAPFEANVWGGDRAMLEAMVPAVQGEVPVFFLTQRERDIRTLLLFLDKYPDVKPVLVGADQAFRVADELAEHGIPVIVGSSLSPTFDTDDPVVAGWENAAVLHRAGVKVAFSTQGVADVRNLPYHAAKAAAFGLPKSEALRAVTLSPAELLGLGAELGSIEAGKRADLVVTDGDPLQIVTQVERMFIGGQEVSLESRHTRLWEAFRERH
jgi:imidazolonepropionase-like amidohydrolase